MFTRYLLISPGRWIAGPTACCRLGRHSPGLNLIAAAMAGFYPFFSYRRRIPIWGGDVSI